MSMSLRDRKTLVAGHASRLLPSTSAPFYTANAGGRPPCSPGQDEAVEQFSVDLVAPAYALAATLGTRIESD
jgi:hypothetical protein